MDMVHIHNGHGVIAYLKFSEHIFSGNVKQVTFTLDSFKINSRPSLRKFLCEYDYICTTSTTGNTPISLGTPGSI
jgi:hypothetical protein